MSSRYFSVKLYEVKNAKKVLFFFPAGFTQMWHYRWTIFLLNRKGIEVVGFNFLWKKAIKECDFSAFIKLIYDINKTVDEFIDTHTPDIEYSTLGLSFGSVLSLYTAKIHSNIKSIILFVPYGTLSHLLWTHKPSRPFIETLIKNGLNTEVDLENLTKPVETLNQLEKLSDRNIISFRGMSDKIVFDGDKIETAIKQKMPHAKLYRSRFGHFGASVIGIAQKKRWISNV